jgi:hypothetical protein
MTLAAVSAPCLGKYKWNRKAELMAAILNTLNDPLIL